MTTPLEPSSEVEQILERFAEVYNWHTTDKEQSIREAKAAIERLITAARVEELKSIPPARSNLTHINKRIAQLTNRDGGDDDQPTI